METCSSGHDEIVHKERECPLCIVLRELEDANGVIDDLKDQISDLSEKDL